MAIKLTNIFFCKTLPKIAHIGIFGLKKKQSGNPALLAPKTFPVCHESLHNVKQAF
jgi:hypothetical protein